MIESLPESVVFGAKELLPEDWKGLAAQGPVRVFNPGLLREGEGWIFAYRVVAADGLRRIAMCRLDRALRVVEGSHVALTDHVRFRSGNDYPEIATRWFADPRLYRFGERVFVTWNSGWHEPRNYQFVQELDRTSLLPQGVPRELVLRGERQKLEKNWTFFRAGDERTNEYHAIYSITPHRVLAFSIAGDGDIEFEEVACVEWSASAYPACHGGLRGGAPPVLADGRFWTCCHSVHDAVNGYRYAAAVYSFEARHPFRPLAGPLRPLALARGIGGNRSYPRLNPAVGDVIYPCGAARDGARWLISHGINDELCAVSRLAHADLLDAMQPIASH